MYATNLKVQLQFYALSFRSCIIEFNEVQIFKIKMMWRESCTLPDQEKSTQYILLRQYLNLNEQKSFHYFIIFRASFTDFTRRLVMISVTGWNFLSTKIFENTRSVKIYLIHRCLETVDPYYLKSFNIYDSMKNDKRFFI